MSWDFIHLEDLVVDVNRVEFFPCQSRVELDPPPPDTHAHHCVEGTLHAIASLGQ